MLPAGAAERVGGLLLPNRVARASFRAPLIAFSAVPA